MMLFFTLDVVLESVLLRKYINKKAHIYTLTSRCELFFAGALTIHVCEIKTTRFD